MAVLYEKIALPLSVEILEMLAARRVIQFAVQLSFHHATFQGDSESVIKALSLGSYSVAVWFSLKLAFTFFAFSGFFFCD